MKIAHKLILTQLAVVGLIAAMGYFALGTVERPLRDTIGQNRVALAAHVADGIDRQFYNRIETFQAYAQEHCVQDCLARSNAEFEAIADVEAHIDAIDREWTAAGADSVTPQMRALLDNELSKELGRKVEFYRAKHGFPLVGEIFLTNRYGANAAESGRTTDYRQNDEQWWQEARRRGYWLGPVGYDESAGVYETTLGIRVHDAAGDFLGVMKAVLNIDDAVASVREIALHTQESLGELEFKLLTADGRLLYATEEFEVLESDTDLPPEAHAIAPGQQYTYVGTCVDGKEALSVLAKSGGHGDFEGSGWLIAMQQHTWEVFRPLRKLRRQMLYLSLLVAVLAVALGLGVSLSVSRGVKSLRAGTEAVAGGNLHHRVGLRTKDEIGDLSRAFDAMTERLQSVTVSRDELEEEVEHRERAEAEVLEYADKLQESNKELEQFAYVASHDLQEPLRAVAGYLQLLQSRCADQVSADAERYVTNAVAGADRMRTLIQDLLTYSRVTTHPHAAEPVDCAELLDQVLGDLSAAIEETGAKITHDDMPTVVADGTQLGQLLVNLVGNAVKFCDDEQPRVHVGAQRQGDEWLFSVRDNGIGIAPEDTERVFLIFKRLHTREEYPGTGIGLAVCKRIVERHGGRIWVESEPGKGATFFFTIPSA